MLAYRRSWLFYPLAILLHFLLDFTTFGIQALTGSLIWTMLLFSLWALAALVLIIRVRHTPPETTAITPPPQQESEQIPTTGSSGK